MDGRNRKETWPSLCNKRLISMDISRLTILKVIARDRSGLDGMKTLPYLPSLMIRARYRKVRE